MSDIEIICVKGNIRLGQLLKLTGICEDGGQARVAIAAGDVCVNGQVELRRGTQLCDRDIIEVDHPQGKRHYQVRVNT